MRTISYPEAVKLVDQGKNVSREERLKLQKERLKSLVDYVRENSLYFKELYKDLKDDYSLNDLPITEKATLLENYDEWVTDRDLNKERVMKYLDRDVSDNSLLEGKYSALKTSGSTGNPLPMVRDDYHNKIHGALVNLRLMAGIDMEILNPSKNKMATVIHTSPGASSYNGYLRALSAFPDYRHNMMALSVLLDIDTIVKKLNEFQPDVLTGYATSLVMLAMEKEKGNLDIPVKMIANSAEMLSDEAYHRIKKAFGCPVINNYCMTEGGEIAMTSGTSELLLNEDWIIVEPVDKNLNPIKDPNEFSDGILVTDLSNYVQPIIRYYVNDRVRIIPGEGDSLPVLQIDGRAAELFELCGKRFSMIPIITKAEVWPGLIQWQILQLAPDTLLLRGICVSSEKKEEILAGLAGSLEKHFRENGCVDAKFTYSSEPMKYNKKGGKVPRYIDLTKD